MAKGKKKVEVILASNSPRRRELFAYLGLNYRVVSPGECEELNQANTFFAVRKMVQVNALNKARTVVGRYPEALIVSADTVVFGKGKVFPKPKDEREAKEFLWFLSRNPHHVYTGVALLWRNEEFTAVERTKVYMYPLSRKEIDYYFSLERPLDKAGGFGIQGFAGTFIYRIEGCFYNVVGLPLARIRLMLKRIGIL